MNDSHWNGIAEVLDAAWPGEFTEDQAATYRVLLDDAEPERVIEALRRLLFAGQKFRPSVAELLSTLHADPSVPTFDEAYRLIFDHPHGLLSSSTRDAKRDGVTRAQAVADRLDVHPLVRAFVQRKGVTYLGLLPVDDPDYGLLRRAELQRDWEAHVAALEGRDVAALAAPRGERGLHSFDPLAALGGPVKQIESAAPSSRKRP
jgi:hypothetical protein